jgi:phosphate-selective porin OprO/OprP
MLTGESHGYKDTAFANPVPSRPAGAVEVAMRYSTVDLDDDGIEGGTEHDWTLGLNWYISKHFKLQANDVRAFSDRGNLEVEPHIYELLAQLSF